MSNADWQPFQECERFITQRSGSGEYRWCHRFTFHTDGRLAAYSGGSVVNDAEPVEIVWKPGMAPDHGKPDADQVR